MGASSMAIFVRISKSEARNPIKIADCLVSFAVCRSRAAARLGGHPSKLPGIWSLREISIRFAAE